MPFHSNKKEITMKKQIFLIALVFCTHVLTAQWIQQNSGTDENLNDVYFINNKGWAVGDEGNILYTDNGGEIWNQQISGTDMSLESVHFVDQDKGWVVASNYDYGIILRTLNAGINWEIVYIEFGIYLKEVFFTDTLNGWIVGNVMLRTTNGGETWEEQNGWGLSVYFADSLNGWNVGGTYNGSTGYPVFHIHHTDDGGNTWVEQMGGQSSEIGVLHSVYFTSQNKGWAVGGNRGVSLGPFSTILHTTDGGNNWEIQNSLSNRVLTGVSFIDSLNGWAVGGFTSFGWVPDTSVLLHTTNGGENWEFVNSGTPHALSSVYFYDQNNGWIVGDSGTILHTNNGGITTTEESQHPGSELQIKYYPNPFSNDLTISWNQTETAFSKIEIYNSTGKRIKELVGRIISKGKHKCHWITNNIPPGLYFIRLQVNNTISTSEIIKLN